MVSIFPATSRYSNYSKFYLHLARVEASFSPFVLGLLKLGSIVAKKYPKKDQYMK